MSDVIVRSGKENMDVRSVHQFLTNDSYWAKGIPFDLVDESLSHSFCVGAFVHGAQVGFARLVTDYSTFGWLSDVYVLPEFRKRGISKLMLSHIMEQTWSKRLRRTMLNTSDGHGLYRQFGFKELAFPARIMEVHRPYIHLEYSGVI
jgi:GNAT superfamily N-acetyltransferase